MVEKSGKRKKCSVSEEDISTLLQRYNATTVLALLREVAQVTEVKIDWNELVKKSSTGITNAREYQMLWRHLAYRHGLADRLDDSALPLDDDSDLEYELEASPAVSSEASAEAAACVKVFIASGVPNDSYLSNGTIVEAPLTINIPTGQTCRNPSDNCYQSISQGTNITVPVFVQKQPLPNVASAEGLDTNGASNATLPPRRKRKPWSEAEDLELIAAVQKCGEGNWANILKGDFKGDRTASQLSQRWAIIRKRQGTLVGNSSQPTEAQLAARRAMSLALDMPMGDNLKAVCSINTAGANTNISPGNPANPPAAETSFVGTQSQNHLGQQQDSGMASQKPGTLGPSKARVPPKKPPTKTTLSPDSMVKAAAVAAGARIATPSDAASLLKAAQSMNAVRIMPGGGGPMVKPPAVGANALPSNVHFIRTGLLSHSKTLPNATRTGPQPVQGHSAKPASQIVQSNLSSTTISGPKASNEVPNGTNSSLAAELDVKTVEDAVISGPKALAEVPNGTNSTSVSKVPNGTNSTPASELDTKTAKDSVISGSETVMEKPAKESRAPGPCNSPEGNKAASTKEVPLELAQVDQTAIPAKEKIEETCFSGDAPKENGQRDQASVSTASAANICVQEKQINSSSTTDVTTVKCSANDRNQAEVECASSNDNSAIVSPVGNTSKEMNEKQPANREYWRVMAFSWSSIVRIV
ncbi:PREDICTED: uncharacterized protein LOC109170597 isoform X2 [Ipomoea nil]|uniref:uncharacterized protein LOC109170597 isoform X2 n=1 Tax=Ipomoea nil TaxID=35883 RepID=UPI0009012CDC|nr:PREDICTED: uncharacterized protein LOC109170597 isoform X2 [Ipomoea nil]